MAVDPQLAEADGCVDDHVGWLVGTEAQRQGVAVVGPLVAVDNDVAVVDVGADLERDVLVDDDLDHAEADAQVGARRPAAARRRW